MALDTSLASIGYQQIGWLLWAIISSKRLHEENALVVEPDIVE
jgi:hypothetical protein